MTTVAAGIRTPSLALSIGDADARLAEWVSSLLSEVQVSFEPPGQTADGRGVSLYLYEVRPQAPARTRMPPVQATLRYLVTTWAPTQQEAHSLLGDLLLAAMEDAELEIDSLAVPIDVWRMFAIAPRPSVVLSLPLRRERNAPSVPMVRQQLKIETAELRPLRGVVVGPSDVPLAGARVEIPLANLATITDRLGRFSFAAVAAGPYATKLRVLAKNRELTLTADAKATEPLVIRFEPLED